VLSKFFIHLAHPNLSVMKYLPLILLVMLIPACENNREKDKIKGVKIYEFSGDCNALVAQWNHMGINTAFVSIQLASDTAFRQVLRKNNIALFVIFPVFQDPEALKQDSTLYAITNKGRHAKSDWVEFVCPSRKSFRNKKMQELASLVHAVDPDGISLDFIRQFVYWEKIYPGEIGDSLERACFCDSCLADFTGTYDYSIPVSCKTTVQKADFLLSHDAVAYNDYRTSLISSMVKDLAVAAHKAKPGVKINVHVVPWRNGDFDGANISVAAQDLKKIAPFTDFISPMCYSQMLKRDANWITDVVVAMDNSAPGKILPSIQVYPYYIDTPFTPMDFKRCLRAALRAPSLGVVFWSWPLFEKDSTRMEAVGSIR
jgi:hypothetical protein